MRVVELTKVHGSYYDFIERFFTPFMKILIGRTTRRLHQTIRGELQVDNKIETGIS